MRLCDKHIPAEMSIGTFRQKCTNQLVLCDNWTFLHGICSILYACILYACHITPQNFEFWPKIRILNEILIFERKFRILSEN